VIFLTYYELLNIKENASHKDIKNAYRVLAKKYHPDTYKGNKSIAEEKMKLINEAYDVLSNSDSRKNYDECINVNKSEIIKEENSNEQSYYNYETGEYKSPDPRDADYRDYYNYSPYNEEFDLQNDYDFSKLKLLFNKSIVKFSLFVIFIFVMLVLVFFIIGQIKTLLIFEHVDISDSSSVENIPEKNYENSSEELEVQIKELEESFYEWYENDGKIYEQQILEGLTSLYNEILNNTSNN